MCGQLELKGTQSVGHAVLRQLTKPDSNPLTREKQGNVGEARLAWGGTIDQAVIITSKQPEGEGRKTEAKGKGKGKNEAEEMEKKKRKTEQRRRQKDEIEADPFLRAQRWHKKQLSLYNVHLRMASSTYVRVPGYYLGQGSQ